MMKPDSRLLVIALLGLFVMGCATTPTGRVVNDDTIKIGVINALTGPSADYGVPSYHAMLLAQEDIRAAGGRLELIFEDGRCDPKKAAAAARKLIDIDKVDAIVTGCSSESFVVAPIAEQEKMLVVAGLTTSPAASGLSPYFFRTSPSDGGAMVEMAELLLEQGHKKIATLTELKDYPKGLSDAFVEAYTGRGGEVVVAETYDSKQTDFRTSLVKMKEGSAIVLFTMTTSSSTNILQQIGELDINLPIFGNEMIGGESVIAAAGLAAEGIIFHTPKLDYDRDETAELLRRLDVLYPNEQSPNEFYDATSYDAVRLTFDAVFACNKDVVCEIDYLKRLRAWKGAGADYQFDENNDPVFDYAIMTVKNGKVIPLT